jgi:hypothetical protein
MASKTNLTLSSFKKWTIIYFLICSVIGWYPFFAIKYFETYKALVTTTKYFLPIIALVAVPIVTKFYFKNLKQLNANHKFKSQTQEKLADFFNCFLIILVVTATFFAMTYSIIITTNAYLGTSDKILINEKVQDYYTSTDKYGKTRRYIKFLNPVDKEVITMEVYRQYNIGDTFEKEMKIGQWKILYSTD